MVSSFNKLQRYIPVNPAVLKQRTNNVETIKFLGALQLFWDYEALFQRFMRECSLIRISQAAGLNMKAKKHHYWSLAFAN